MKLTREYKYADCIIYRNINGDVIANTTWCIDNLFKAALLVNGFEISKKEAK